MAWFRDEEERKKYELGLRPASEQKVMTTKTVVNLDKQTNESAARLAARVPTDEKRDEFIETYRSHVKKKSSPNYQKSVPTLTQMRSMADASILGGIYTDTRAKYNESRVLQNKSINTLNSLGVTDFGGAKINWNTISFDDAIRTIRLIPDANARKTALATLKDMTKEGGRFSRYSAYDFSTSANAYIANSDFDMADYEEFFEGGEYTRGVEGSFSAAGGDSEENRAKYEEFLARIDEKGLTDWQKQWYIRRLDDIYYQTTGVKYQKEAAGQDTNVPAMADGEVAESATAQTEKTQDQPEADKPPQLGDVWKALGTIFSAGKQAKDEPEKDEEAPSAPEPSIPEMPSPSPSPTPTPSPTPIEGEDYAVVGEYASATASSGGRWIDSRLETAQEVMDNPQPLAPPETAQQPEQTQEPQEASIPAGTVNLVGDPVRAAEYVLAGRGNELDEETRAYIDGLMKSSTAAKAILGGWHYDEQELANRVLYNEDGLELDRYVKMFQSGQYQDNDISYIIGGRLGGYYNKTRSDTFPAELTSDTIGMIFGVAMDAEEAYRNGQITYNPAEETYYDAYLRAHPEALANLDGVMRGIYEMQKEKREYDQLVADAIAANKQAQIESAREAVRTGDYDYEQYQLVVDNAPVMTDLDLKMDPSYVDYNAEIRAYVYDAYDDAESWIHREVLDCLEASGLAGADMHSNAAISYLDMLHASVSDQMMNDLRVARSLGYDDLAGYYAKMGGFSVEALADRAKLSLQALDAQIDPDTVEYVSSFTGTDDTHWGGAIVSGAYVGIRESQADRLEAIWALDAGHREDRPYYEQQMRQAYGEKYGYSLSAYMYKQDMLAFADAHPSAEMGQYIREYIESGADVFRLAIKPEMTWSLNKAAEIQRKADAVQSWAESTYAPSMEGTFNISKSAGANAEMQATAIVVGAITGSAEAGVAVGFGLPQITQETEAQLAEGKSMKYASTMGLMKGINTVLAESATSGALTKKALQIVGIAPMLETAGNAISNSRVVNAMVGMIKNAAGQIWDETIVDEIKEGTGWQVLGKMTEEMMSGSGIITSLLAGMQNIDVGETISGIDMKDGIAVMLPNIFISGLGGAMQGWKATKQAAQKVAQTGTPEAAKEFVEAFAQDVVISENRAELDGACEAMSTAVETAGRMMTDPEITPTVEEAMADQEQASAHAQEAESSRARMDADMETIEEIDERMNAGEINPDLPAAMASAAQDHAKAKQGLDEHTREQAQKSADADRKMGEAHSAASAKAAQTHEAEKMTLKEQLTVKNYDSLIAARDQIQSRIDEIRSTMENYSDELDDVSLEQADADLMQAEADLARIDEQIAQAETRVAPEYIQQRQAARDAEDDLNAAADEFVQDRYGEADEDGQAAVHDAYIANAQQAAQEARTEQTAQEAENPSAEAQETPAVTKEMFDFASRVQRKFGTRIRFVDDIAHSAGGSYENGVITIPKSASRSEVLRRVMTHELTHHAETSGYYKQLAASLKDIQYGGDAQRMQADLRAIIKTYVPVYQKEGRTFTEADAERELVAKLNEQILGGNEEIINRIVGERPSLARRIYEGIRQIMDRLRGNRDPEMIKLQRTARLFERALKDAQKNQSAEAQTVLATDTETGEMAAGQFSDGTAAKYSLRTWTPKERSEVRQSLIEYGFSDEEVDRWIDDVDGVASLVAADKDRLDFTAADNHVMLKPNQEYVKTLDASTLCAKRLLYQGTFNAVQHAMPNTVMTSDDLIRLRNMMAHAGYETPCGICYVESRRRNLGVFAKKWLDGYDVGDGYQPSLDDVTTTDGLEKMRLEHPEVYRSFVDEMNRKGSNNPKVVQLRTEYNGDIRTLTPQQTKKIVEIGGLRVQSFSDFETPHLLDMMQAVLDMSAQGLTSQAYTKVPNFAAVFGDTGIKINLSLIAEDNGLDENGNLIFSSYEGMDFDRAMELRDMYSENVGTILVGLSDEHIRVAMADPRIDFIIPFHKSGWGKRQLSQLSGMQGYKDYTREQNERRVVGTTKTGKPKTKNVEENFHPVDYWDYSKSGNENAATYLRMCEDDNRIPKFSRLLSKDSEGHWVAPDGYWKLLIDFKMYDNDGNGAPQRAVQPTFNMDEARRVLSEYEGGADTLPVAQDIVRKFVSEKKRGGAQYSLKTEMDGDISISDAPGIGQYIDGKRINRNEIIRAGMLNVKSKNNGNNTANRSFIQNKPTDRPIQITPASLRHSLTGTFARQSRNAKMSLIIGDIAESAIPVSDIATREGAKRSFLMLGAMQDEEYVYPIRLTIVETDEDMGEITGIETMEGISKQYLYAADARDGIKKGTGVVMTRGLGDNAITLTGSEISIADLWGRVKDHFFDNIEMPKYSLPIPSGDALNQEIRAYQTEMANRPVTNEIGTETAQGARNLGERQFATQTVQESQAAPQWLQDYMMTNHGQRYYERDTNDAQLMRAWGRIQREGYEAVRDRLLTRSEIRDSDDVADANVIMAMAFRDDDVNTALSIARLYNTEGTKAAQGLQARKLFQRMTPLGMQTWVAGQTERQLDEYRRTHKAVDEEVKREAKKVADKIKDLRGGNELLRLNAGGSVTVDASNSKWGVPVSPQHEALIKHYGLENVRRPGDHYNGATKKQRMLEAILQTPNPLEMTGNGLNLIQRLEFIKRGQACFTNADLHYIGHWMSVFAHSPMDDQESRIGDIALSRVYEAYGNITEAGWGEKAQTWRYTSMLLSVPSALRNVVGNATMNVINDAANDLAAVLDMAISAATGSERTRALRSIKDRIDGWEAFVAETGNTFRDYFIDKTITQHGSDRFSLNQRGRTYQTEGFEAIRRMEGLLMSVGDRNYWRRAYLNSMNEQMQVAKLNGTELDFETARENAENAANYAVFNEDNAVRTALSSLKQNGPPEVKFMLNMIMPFTGVPTNIAARIYQYSPAGLARTVIQTAADAINGRDFDQQRFVTNLARSGIGTGLLYAGMQLVQAGLFGFDMGTGAEDDDGVYAIESAQGKQYGPYIRIGDQYVQLNILSPAIMPLLMGAAAQEALNAEGSEEMAEVAKNAALAAFDTYFSSTFLTGVQDVFGGYGSVGENLLETVVNNAVSQNVPALLTQWADAMDPYVRDTKDKNFIMQAIKTGIITRVPGWRETLPIKTDVTGAAIESKSAGQAFFDPTTRKAANDDATLQGLLDLADRVGETGFLPSMFIGSNSHSTTILKSVANAAGMLNGQSKKIELTSEEKAEANRLYGDILFNGTGDTDYYMPDGRKLTIEVPGIRAVMASDLTDAEKMDRIKNMKSAVKQLVQFQILGWYKAKEGNE